MSARDMQLSPARPAPAPPRSIRRLGLTAAVSVAVGSFAGWAFLSHPAARRWVARVDGAVIQVEPAELLLKATVPAASNSANPIPLSVSVRNLTSGSIRIVGARTSCRCLTLAPLPVTLPPHSSTAFTFQIVRALNAPFEEQIRLFTDPGGLDATIRVSFPGVER